MDKIWRGKTKQGEWVYGYYIKTSPVGKSRHDDWIVVDAVQNGGWMAFTKRYAVIPESVGKRTGKNDCFGDSIYEGDIVKVTGEDDYACVEYSTDDARFELIFDKMSLDLGECYDDDLEIMGNIFDNPELMQRG